MCMVQNKSEHLSPATYCQQHCQQHHWHIAGNCLVFFLYFVPYFRMLPAIQNVQFLIGLCFCWQLFGGEEGEKESTGNSAGDGRRGRKNALAMGRERVKETGICNTPTRGSTRDQKKKMYGKSI